MQTIPDHHIHQQTMPYSYFRYLFQTWNQHKPKENRNYQPVVNIKILSYKTITIQEDKNICLYSDRGANIKIPHPKK